jgi:hypothetical protein
LDALAVIIRSLEKICNRFDDVLHSAGERSSMNRCLILFFCVVIFMTIGVGIGHAQKPRWKVGDRVLVNWSQDEFWYPATITKVSRPGYYIVFDDGDEEWTTTKRVVALRLGIRQRVFVNRKHEGFYYPGRIVSKRKNIITVLYDDGIRETTTVAGVRLKMKT